MLQGMADWYLKGEPFDQARLIRVLEVAHELKVCLQQLLVIFY